MIPRVVSMLGKAAHWVDRRDIRGFLTVLLLFAWLMLGPLSLLSMLGPPVSFLLGLGGLAGLSGASSRIFSGPGFFLLSRGCRRLVVSGLVAGAGATVLAFVILPARIYWATPIWLVGLAGIVTLAGSITDASARAAPSDHA
jgi:hypothetical protein